MTTFTETQLVNVKQQFNALDKDGDGLIGENEFIEALKNADRNPEDYDTQAFFASADKNKDGKITFNEFVDACQSLGLAEIFPVSGQPVKRSPEDVDRIFRNFDRNNDGHITREELTEALARQGESPSGSEVQDMMDAADKNKDDKIDREEFSNVV
ncbi:hypothetical protein BGZ80_005526 [Entomortierella chlamydospora]|uniref:EF-hand domain-containing protein n=1 Tax=Entomortierella chlamydospora TaxID=101097 RepID=A0A9P6MJG7_9FUNG|nr:hypothetical protein BGZ79_004078 [Entomortierella chlamydospora]KAG0004984.1 hypothetical protein BGZ80_005526 [Entomortierella chlamydospora]